MARLDTTPTVPSDEDIALARQACRALAEHPDGQPIRLGLGAAGRKETTLDVPPAAAKLLLEALTAIGNGQMVTLLPSDVEITTQQAADLLNVSRPYVVNLIDKGVLPARMVGNQRRLPLKDVQAYSSKIRAQADEALLEMTAIDQELGLR